MNKVVLKGNICKEVELKQAGETYVIQNSIAVQRKYKKEGTQDTDFINIKIWGKTAEFVSKYFQKGSQILISGRIETGSYEKEDGTRIYTTDVVAEEVEFCGKFEKKEEIQVVVQEGLSVSTEKSDDLPF